MSILDLAAAGKKQEILDAIKDHSYEDIAKNINDADSEGRTALHHAVLQGWHDLVAPLVKAGANIHQRDAQDGTALYRAVELKDVKSASALLELGAKPDVRRNDDGLTALHIAISDENLPMTKLLLQWGADVALKTPPKGDGMNAYHFAARVPAILDLLLETPDADALQEIFTADRKKQSVLRIALERSDRDLVTRLLDYGVDVNERDDNGETPLLYLLGHRDSREKTLPMIKLLLERGADLDKLSNYWGETVLFPAVDQSYTEAVKMLLELGADAKAVNVQGESLLHIAAKNHDAKIVRMLAKGGADLDARDRNKQTPLHIAANKNKLDVVDALLNAGADPFAKDKNGKTPRDLAPAEFQSRVNHLIAEKEKELEIKKYGYAMYAQRHAAEAQRLAAEKKESPTSVFNSRNQRGKRFQKPSSRGWQNRR